MCALNCEAKALIDKFKLKKVSDAPFVSYSGAALIQQQAVNVDVVISGIGAISMAAAAAWLGAQQQGLHHTSVTAVWLNIGIAGHAQLDVGEPFIVSMSQSVFSQRNFYPPQVARRSAALSPCMSLNAPSSDYPETGGIDMEASAFFDVAGRFSDTELVQSFKVVSDTPEHGVENLNAATIHTLMQPHTDAIILFSSRLLGLAQSFCLKPKERVVVPDVRATHSQQQQLKDIAERLSHSLEVGAIESLNADLCNLAQSHPNSKRAVGMLLECMQQCSLTIEPKLVAADV